LRDLSPHFAAWRGRYRIDQVLAGISPGDAISDEVLAMQRALRSWGFESGVYAEHIHPDLVNQVQPLSALGEPRGKQLLLIYHYGIGSGATVRVRQLGCKVVLVYHNVTPPHLVLPFEPRLAALLELGRAELPLLVPHTVLALGDSDFNRKELEKAGFRCTGVLPLLLDFSRYAVAPDLRVLEQFRENHVNFIFVGRIVGNKKQEDLIRLFAYYQQVIQPQSRLFLIGTHGGWEGYYRYLQRLVARLGVRDVHFTGYVTQSQLAAYYKLAHVFISMSEHEGFFVPALESMYYRVPVLAYAAGAVPETLGEAGVLFRAKEIPVITEMAHLLATDEVLRQRVIAAQERRLTAFQAARTLEMFADYVREALEGKTVRV